MRQQLVKNTVTRLSTPDERSYRGRSGPIKFDIIIHCSQVPSIVINYPGVNGDINGYNDKYRKIAEMICGRGIGAAIQMSNTPIEGLDYSKSVINDLKAVIEYALANAPKICGTAEPDLYLMGFSAGASAVAAVCADYPQVKKILLVAPSGDADEEAVTANLHSFTGEVYIAVGQNDEVVGVRAGEYFAQRVKKAAVKDLRIVPNCDHQFRGSTNGRIMSKSPLWAFAGDDTFPSPDGGMELY